MNKKLLAAAVLAIGMSCSAVAMSACSTNSNGGNNNGGNQGQNPAEDGIYTVTFVTNGGSAVQAVDVAAGQSIDLNSYVTQNSDDSYYFFGWYLDEAISQRAPTNFTPASDVTLYAGWGADETYTLTFDSCGGSAVAAQEYKYYEYLTAPEQPTREGYSFDGWYWDADYSREFIFVGNTMIADDLTVYAKWTRLYTLTFDTDGGSAVDSKTGEEGTVLTAPADPVKEGYIFDGWFADEACTQPYSFTSLTADATVYAGWHPVQTAITVTLEVNSPVEGVSVQPVTITGVVEGNELETSSYEDAFEDAVNAGLGLTSGQQHVYIFGGWAYDREGTQPFGGIVQSSSEGSLTLYAKWLVSARYCTLTFTGGDGSLVVITPKAEQLSQQIIDEINNYYGENVTLFVAQDGTVYSLTDSFSTNLTLSPAVAAEGLTFELNQSSNGYILTSYTGNSSSVVIPSSYNGLPVTAIGEGAFRGNANITSVTLPAGVTSIGRGAFEGCSSLAVVEGGDYLASVGYGAFAGTQVGYAVRGIVYLNSAASVVIGYNGELPSALVIPASVKVIAQGAFEDNGAITSLSFGANSLVSYLPASAFAGCTSLSSINLSNAHITSIGDSAFAGCVLLNGVTLPSLVSSLGDYAFSGCTQLSQITMSGIRTIGSYAFENCAFTTIDWTGLNLSAVSEGMFSGCGQLTSIVLPGSVSSIGANAFAQCAALANVTVNAPEIYRLTSIGDSAFAGCSALRTIILFSRIQGDSPLEIGQNALSDCADDLVVYVADGAPTYNNTSNWYDGESDAMLTYAQIYSNAYEGITFLAADMSSPVISAENKAIMLYSSQIGDQINVIDLLLANGVSASDNVTASDDLVYSIDSVIHITPDGGTTTSSGSVEYPEITAISEGVYDLSELGAYRVSIRATDRFGNSNFTVVTISVVN